MEKRLEREHGIVLHHSKYGENQLIVHLLTSSGCRRSYITRIGRSNSKSSSMGAGRGMFQPLFILEFMSEQGRGDMHRMSQVTHRRILSDLPFDIAKSSIAMFISELLYRLLHNNNDLSDHRLYDFVEQSIIALDAMGDGTSNFHLHFMVRLTYYLGISPSSNYCNGAYLDIKTGRYSPTQPAHTLWISPSVANTIYQLSQINILELAELKLNQKHRQEVMHNMVNYYHFHTDAIHTVRSIDILGELF